MTTPDSPKRPRFDRMTRPAAAAIISSLALTACAGHREPNGPTNTIKAVEGDTLKDIFDKKCGTTTLLPSDWLYKFAEPRIMSLEGNDFDPKRPIPDGTPVVIEDSICYDMGYPTENLTPKP